jgi:hypothetical protein
LTKAFWAKAAAVLELTTNMGHPIQGNTLNIGFFGQKLMPHWRRDIPCERPRVAKTPVEGDSRLYGHDAQYCEDNGSGQ